ncbi:MAG: TonB-dependent receptor [Pseudomonadota bacterium]
MKPRTRWDANALAAVLICLPLLASAAGVPGAAVTLDPVTVTASQQLIGAPDSATVGTVYADQLGNRTISRTGELLEVVPGLIVTQHSGEGKANQYFLRGYNLDHGTDFAIFVDGLPVNTPTHAHGQGYADNGFMIPELVESIEYRKGPYYAQYGDFAVAGAAEVRYKSKLEESLVEVTGGAFGYGRLLNVGSQKLGAGDLVYGAEYVHYDGPYELGQHYNKGNLLLRYSERTAAGGYHLAASGYSTRNLSPDQIPQRAVDQGAIGRLGSVDPTDGGYTHRINFSGGLDRQLGPGTLTLAAYAFRYRLELFSNFTYLLDDPVNGDQFNQSDKRNVYGGQASYKLPGQLLGLPLQNEIGVQTRYDDIDDVGLYLTRERERLATTTVSDVKEWTGAVYAQSAARLSPWARFTLGARFDSINFDVANNNAANSGRASDTLFSPKAALILGPFEKTEFFINVGQGFHSNDARGATQTFDPRSGDAVRPVTPLAPARGIDLGIRTALIPKVQVAASVFRLRSESELIYVGDAGTTEPFGATERYGGELAIYARPLKHLVVDADLAYTQARFQDQQVDEDGNAIGKRVPQAVQGVAALGMSYDSPKGWDTALRVRYFGKRPLDEGATVFSQPTTIVNVGAGYHFTKQLKVSAQITNLFDSKDHDIDYLYSSRLSGEPAEGVEDVHFHPIEPINARLSLRYAY